MGTFTIAGLLIVLAAYAAISYFYLNKKLRIKPRRRGMFHQDRKRVYIWIDGAILILFTAAMFEISVEFGLEKVSGLRAASPVIGLFFLLGLVHAAEEWATNRKGRVYYYELLGSAMLLAVFLVILAGES